MHPNTSHGVPSYSANVRGNMAFTQVNNDTNGKRPQKEFISIILNSNTFMKDWFKKGV